MSRFYGTTSFTTSFEFPLLSNSYMQSTNIEGLQDKQNSKNTGGIMRYQLRIFQLILVVFSNGCVGGLEKVNWISSYRSNLRRSESRWCDSL